MRVVGAHSQVYEYDGAFKCLACQQSWGALPGNPKIPEICKLSERSKRILAIQVEISNLESELSYLYQIQQRTT